MRTVFVIGLDKKIKLMMTYPMITGRNFDEIRCALDSMQLSSKHNLATPVNWKDGGDVIVSPLVSDSDAKANYPGKVNEIKPNLRTVARTVAQPK